ncbi:hypothetical protein [Wolbachia endosymbiont of Atemnus politus]|uniref:hypothetical protein n=1 Tax=Wolbachia endosymbiont of Atemnus politus TaxID=2682840 RepID=UPI0031B576A7
MAKKLSSNRRREIVERNKEDIDLELLENAKLAALDSVRFYFNNCTHQYAGNSHQKSKSYSIQARAAESILAFNKSGLPFAEEDLKVIEPLAKVRGISEVQMAELIQEKVKIEKKAIIKCEELVDIAEREINEAKSEKELQTLLSDLKQKMQKVLES